MEFGCPDPCRIQRTARGEQCDDGDGSGGDGCSASCQIEANWVCPEPGQPCSSTIVCGDRRRGGDETCDDGGLVSADGCSSACAIEPGWVCPTVGLPCRAAECGDGILAGLEECEYVGAVAPTGCTDCHIDPGYDCDPADFSCAATECGNGEIERGERCEDGNELPFDGCFHCQFEPICADGECVAVCGDGQRFASEDCDDGNTRPFDGCSSNCEVETAFTCQDVLDDPVDRLLLPVVLRDFIAEDHDVGTLPSHPDFNKRGGSGIIGMLERDLAIDGRPIPYCPGGDCTLNPAYSLQRNSIWVWFRGASTKL